MENNIDEFLYIFKEIEKEIIQLSELKDNRVSFSQALNTVYYQKQSPVINYDNYTLLKSAADVRNILSHANDICFPSSNLLLKMKKILNELQNPVSIFDVATKDVYVCSNDDLAIDVMNKMDELSITHVPIVNNDNLVIGVFSRGSIFDALIENLKLNSSLHISDLTLITALGKHHNEAFLFASKNKSIYSVFEYLGNREPKKKHVACIFITSDGSKKTPLLGLVTYSDLFSYFKN